MCSGSFCFEETAQVAPRRRGRPASRHDVRHQALVLGRVLADRHHRGLPHPGVLASTASISPELDPEAPELHLVVDAPEELDRPVGAVAGEVPGLVKAAVSPWVERDWR